MIPKFSHTLLVCLVVAGFAISANGFTSIVILRTSKEIVIAADSKETERTSGGTVVTDSLSICKIKRTGKHFWAAAQVVKDDLTGFSVEQYVVTSYSSTSSVLSHLNRFSRLVAAPLNSEFSAMQTRSPARYAAIRAGLAILEIAFFGVENKRMVLHVRYFTYHKTDGGFVVGADPKRNIDCPGAECSPHIEVVALGERQAIASYFKANPEPHWRTDIEAAPMLVNIEKSAAPESVGGPVNVFTLTPATKRWINDEVGCQQEQQKALRALRGTSQQHAH